MVVKICGITDAGDALAAVAAGAGAIGFNFYVHSPRYISVAKAAAIAAQLPSNVLKVGVFVNEPAATIERIAKAARLDVAQLHGDETANDWPTGIEVWKAMRVQTGFILAQLAAYPADAFLLDAPGEFYGGNGTTFDWSLAAGSGKRILIAGGLDDSNVAAAIEAAMPWGVDACSRLESSPGIKDHARMARFLDRALAIGVR